MSKRYSGKSFKDSSVLKKSKLSFKEKRKIKREKKNKHVEWGRSVAGCPLSLNVYPLNISNALLSSFSDLA